MPKTHIWTTPTASYPTMVDTLYQKKHESIKYNTLEKEHMSRFSQDYNKNNIISDQTKTSRFYSKISKDWCDITINVRHIKYLDGADYYYIEYNNVFKITQKMIVSIMMIVIHFTIILYFLKILMVVLWPKTQLQTL